MLIWHLLLTFIIEIVHGKRTVLQLSPSLIKGPNYCKAKRKDRKCSLCVVTLSDVRCLLNFPSEHKCSREKLSATKSRLSGIPSFPSQGAYKMNSASTFLDYELISPPLTNSFDINMEK